MNSEFTNFFRSVGVMIMLMVLVTLGLYRIAYITGAGNAAFYQSLLFVFGQAVVQILFYGLWYRKVNRLAADRQCCIVCTDAFLWIAKPGDQYILREI